VAYKRKSDQRIAASRHYDKNKAAYKMAAKRHDKIKAEQIRSYVAGYLSRHPCLDCGEPDPIVLEFDHRVRNSKVFNIGDAIQKGFALTKVVAEIEKCDVRCANCHRRKTAREQKELAVTKGDELPPLPLFDR
jgi:5-methylcytosine-specific restriction endonuclease McrA